MVWSCGVVWCGFVNLYSGSDICIGAIFVGMLVLVFVVLVVVVVVVLMVMVVWVYMIEG